MRKHAAAALRNLQAARTARPSEPCAVLVGESNACEQVRLALGGARREPSALEEEEACVHGESLNGVFLVEPPEALRDVAEVTELATFLRGLQDAHALLVAHEGGRSSEASPKEELADVLSLISDFYSPQDWRSFVTVVSVGQLTAPGDEAAQASICQALRRYRVATKVETMSLPRVVHLGDPEGPRQLLAHLRTRPALACEPLQANSALMSQYRVIRQQLSQRRPPSSHSSASKVSKAVGAVSNSQAVSSTSSPQRAEAVRREDRSSATSNPSSPQRADAARREERRSPLRPGGKRNWTVMVFGKTGAGKSHLANLMVGFQAFESGDSLASVTNQDSVRKARSADGTLTVLDTIGFGDTRLPPETVVRSLRDTALEAPDGIDALFFVLKKERVTTAEQETLAYVTQLLFGPDCLPNLYMVVTHAGRLAKEVESRGPWLREQADASPPFAAMLATLGAEPGQRVAFVENSDPSEAEDAEDRVLAEKRRRRALDDVLTLLERHSSPAYRHGIMRRAGELQAAHMEELRRELRQRVEDEVRQELNKDRGALEEERRQLRAEVEDQRLSLRQAEEELQLRFEKQWTEMKSEFEQRARTLARGELEPMAKDIVEKTEKKAATSGRRCTLM